jgi:hypothetical protein
LQECMLFLDILVHLATVFAVCQARQQQTPLNCLVCCCRQILACTSARCSTLASCCTWPQCLLLAKHNSNPRHLSCCCE